jgi:pimeloyl-ACP methyl ester carboxylesterase
MEYPIVKVKAKDGLTLHGLILKPQKEDKKFIIIHFHGTAGSFFWNDFCEEVTKSVISLGISFLAANNRGAGVYEVEEGIIPHGASLEKFENCLFDFDIWIEFALSKGYKNIILQGHSFGTEKVVYYMNKGEYKDRVKAIILLGFSDNVGTQEKYQKKIRRNYFNEAKRLVRAGKGDYLLEDLRAFAGELPISAKTYLNFFSVDSENAKALPLRKGRDLKYFRNIKVPTLGVIGDREEEEYTIVSIKKAIELMRRENRLAEVYQIKDCGHGFEGKEKELAVVISNFLKKIVR